MNSPHQGSGPFSIPYQSHSGGLLCVSLSSWIQGRHGYGKLITPGSVFLKSNSSLLELFTPHQISLKLWTTGSPGKCRKKAECIQGFNTSKAVSHVSRLHPYRCHLGAHHPLLITYFLSCELTRFFNLDFKIFSIK